jgi:ABC-type antimicrobial peptide transport system permease subunit
VAKGAFAAAMVLLFIRAFVYPVVYVVLLGGFALGLLFISAATTLAMLIPALRALRIDPAEALRAD